VLLIKGETSQMAENVNENRASGAVVRARMAIMQAEAVMRSGGKRCDGARSMGRTERMIRKGGQERNDER
jgi:hypothetical protein